MVSRTPPPPPPAAPEKCSDMDNDGVCDTADKCPNTPAGAKVDKVGCPLEQTLKLLFDFDSAELRPESIEELERLVRLLADGGPKPTIDRTIALADVADGFRAMVDGELVGKVVVTP